MEEYSPQEMRRDMEEVRRTLERRYGRQPLAYVKTYGCQQNVSDSERLMGMLFAMGYGETDDPQKADLILLNTCAVRESAENRVLGNLGALKSLYEKNPSLIVAVCGCMAQRPEIARKIRESYGHVGLLFGANAPHRLPGLLLRALTGERVIDTSPPSGEIPEGVPVHREGRVKAWLPIMQGCDNFCSYCIVPYVRGRERSRPMDEVLSQARALVQEGYREITLLGQNVNSYGKGVGADFPTLLRRLSEVEGDFRIRFMTSHPKDCSEALIDAVASSQKVCSHIHLPVQSGSSRILREMNRQYTAEEYLRLIDLARERILGVHFTSDIIVGFPGETEEDFEETLRLVRRVRYTSLFTFLYSRRSGTKAAELPDPVTPEEKARRFQRLLDTQESIGRAIHEEQVGRVLRVLIEGPGREEGLLTGRTESGIITQLPGPESLIGQFVPVRITKALNWALCGEAAEQDTKF